MGLICLLNAPAGSGKDESIIGIDFTEHGLTSEVFRFAEYIKNETHKHFGISNIPFDHYENVKDIPNIDFDGKTPREAYIYVSEKILKPKYGRDFVAKHLKKELRNSEADIKIVTDLGFEEEFDAGLDVGDFVFLIKIERAGHTFEKDSRKYVKSRHRDNLLEVFIRNTGTIEDLKRKVEYSIMKCYKGKCYDNYNSSSI